jgi:hypothetical protein
VRGQFYSSIQSGDYRLNLVIVEDSVVGTGTGYDQANAYYDGNDTNHPYYQVGDYQSNGTWYIENYVHRYVARDYLAGAWGEAVINSPVNDGDTFSKDYTFTLDQDWDPAQISLVAMIQAYDQDPDNRPIINADQRSLLVSSSAEGPAVTDAMAVNVLPNPVSSVATIDLRLPENAQLNIQVRDLTGRVVATVVDGAYAKGRHNFYWDASSAAAGVYVVHVEGESTHMTQKIVVH